LLVAAPIQDIPPPSAPKGTSPYCIASVTWPAGTDVLEVPTENIARMVIEIASIEAPLHIDEIIRRIREAGGAGRAGSKIRAHIELAVLQARHLGAIELREDFAYRPGQKSYPVRNRIAFAPNHKRIGYVAPEEIIEAAISVIRESVAVSAAELARPVANLLGFERVTPDIAEHIDKVIEIPVASGRLKRIGDKLRIA
jgi:hypothetical protein